VSPYDLVIIGGGSAGLTAASFAVQTGARVLLLEADRLGGDCTWTGCVPSKALIHAARLAQGTRKASWIEAGKPDFARAMREVRAAVDRVYSFETPERLRATGVDVVMEAARFLDPRTVQAGSSRFQGDRFVICTGAAAETPPIPGLRETPHLTHETVFDLDRLPDRLLVLGGGATGSELAQAFARLGSQVTIFDLAGRLLPAADPEASRVIEDRFRSEGIRLCLNSAVEAVQSDEDRVVVAAGGESFEGDELLVALGRRPRVEGLNLAEAGVVADVGGIRVDSHLRTSQPGLYAAGDVTGGPQFTHQAAWQGFTAARNALLPGRASGRKQPVPWAVFTDPEVAQVGLDETQARERVGGRVTVLRWPIERIDRAQADGESAGFIKVLAQTNGRLLGATIVSPAAGELANELTLALEARLTLGDLAEAMHVYPTYGIALQQLASAQRIRSVTSGWRGRLLRGLRRIRRQQ